VAEQAPEWSGGHAEALDRARAALLRQEALRPRNRDSGLMFRRLETQREAKDDG
jgi:hypothetical protein